MGDHNGSTGEHWTGLVMMFMNYDCLAVWTLFNPCKNERRPFDQIDVEIHIEVNFIAANLQPTHNQFRSRRPFLIDSPPRVG